jgi:hypothetical protein
MGGKIQSGNYNHDLACSIAESSRQSAVAGLPNTPSGQLSYNQAEIAWARAIVNSCRVNNNNQGGEAFQTLLRALGTGGT